MRAFWLLSLLLWTATPARADVNVTPRHLLILREGLDTLYGSYVFAIQNTGDKPEHFKTPVMLPKETDDFSPQEGVEAAEITLAPGGGVIVEKDVPPGVLIISIGFRVPGRYGHSVLTLTPGVTVDNFTLLVPRQSGIQATSSMLAVGDAANAPDPQYLPLISANPLKIGEALTIEVGGLPEGRTRIWIVGACVAAMLLAMAGFFAWRTRPKITTDGGSSVLVG